MPQFTHLDEKGRARMVDVSAKRATSREAVARGRVLMKPETARAIEKQTVAKGDVLAVAKIAGVMAAKRTSDLIPLCHPLEITAVDVAFRTDARRGEIEIEAAVRTRGRTGVEMEALTAVSAAALTIYDMCKAADRAMTLSDIQLVLKRGGKSGTFRRKD
ncbi:MAG: cyclic pyranopterin monophosphate synthase MoaC [Pseudomonadota bacterium]|jgi:cyclic pyranopterin phosphate synthase|nr:cyclic pyranopterin monophosphate synthase MoaC [Syntrophaceae bacterium]MDI9555883.1 cyclic pyranopterin monophosphate synthase MoaC [Pseudomonadota bacterium]NLX32006.1 cyclic pyranopterin monophosphate synthase MoaC [Deltaproteobacteria bacterium]HNU86464.1 cyclic pyranopterin monophosphate synthase MoaC [Syntrophales bacterium]HNZ34399.1 cyclic pyranopterin monophosphate synthase MoaC [Syntrophales bacterium]